MTKQVTIKSERCLPEFIEGKGGPPKRYYVSTHRHGNGELEIGLHFQVWEGFTTWTIAWVAARMLWIVFRNRRGTWVGRPKAAKKAEAAE
jgi:hypothetical protein